MLQAGDLSTSYPLLRASPVLLVVLVSFILGTEEGISGQSICGIFLVAVGCFLLPMRRFGDLRIGNYVNATSGFALLAAVGIVGYSMLDDRALKILRAAHSIELSNFNLTVLYAFSQAVCLTIWLLIFILRRKERLRELARVFQTRKRKAALTGVMIYLTYILVLLSMASVKNVSYVVAFRQISIPLGAIAGIFILGEKCYRPKFAGISVLLVGLLLVSTG
jgi:drug/metabolite transporter (DMT)-like permease